MQLMIRLGEETVSCDWEKKKVKNINLRLRPDGSFTVSSAPWVPRETVEAFLRKALPRLLQSRERLRETRPGETLSLTEGAAVPYLGGTLTLRLQKGERPAVRLLEKELFLLLPDPSDKILCRRLLEGWWKEKFAAEAALLLDRWFPRFEKWQIPYPTLRFRRMTSRWGSCQPATAAITLNLRLLHAPEACLEYIIVHELAHLVVADHSASFHAVVTAVQPDWKARRALLKRSVIPL